MAVGQGKKRYKYKIRSSVYQKEMMDERALLSGPRQVHRASPQQIIRYRS